MLFVFQAEIYMKFRERTVSEENNREKANPRTAGEGGREISYRI